MSGTAWMDRALCKEIGPHPFDLRKGDRITPARKVCRACSVRIECLDYALAEFDRDSDTGVWGGTSVNERRATRDEEEGMSAALFALVGAIDRQDVMWSVAAPADINPLLAREHYLGPLVAGGHSLIVSGTKGGETVAAQVWRRPTSRSLPADGTWLELSRWCLTPDAGDNAGSRMHKWAARLIREHLPEVTTLVSYSDPGHGHDGALYRASNWQWRPTWLRLRPPPTGNGSWQEGVTQGIKDRWVFPLRPDDSRESVTHIGDPGAIRHWRANSTENERRWARTHPQLKDTP